ncbi:MAG: UbiX family flavin prenyltransferase [Fervidicoccaceae archaeon]
MNSVTIGITGASGIVYGIRTLEELLASGMNVSVIYTSSAEKVAEYEIGRDLKDILEDLSKRSTGKMKVYRDRDLDAPIASSSNMDEAVIVVPCSMKTLAQIAYGISNNLIVRTSLNALRMKRPLVLVPRETPLGYVELRAMLRVSEAGAIVLPAMPAFYIRPKSIDDMVNFIVGKVFDTLGLKHSLYRRWEGKSDKEGRF